MLEPEVYYPLKVFTCERCFLVQIDEYKAAKEIFDVDYAYFSSYSSTWLNHCSDYTNMICERFGYNQDSLVVELASNDGYLLQYFKQKGIPVLGVEPSLNTARHALGKGIDCITDYFSSELATKEFTAKGRRADLVIANNVLAHVPDIVDFVRGISLILKETGVLTVEFPHLLQLMLHNQFDTIYHEHFSYLSLVAVRAIFESQGLSIFDVQEIATHGGSLRIYAKHKSDISKPVSESVKALVTKEEHFGITDIDKHLAFQEKALKIKYAFLEFLLEGKRKQKKIAAYGAAAKGNTLLNFCGVKSDMINFVADASPHKQNKFLPGSHIPIVSAEKLREYKPDFVIIFPWNIKEEVCQQLAYVRDWGAKFVVAVPQLTIF